MSNFDIAKANAIQIRDEVEDGKNTARRVGDALLSVIDSTEKQVDNIDDKVKNVDALIRGGQRIDYVAQPLIEKKYVNGNFSPIPLISNLSNAESCYVCYLSVSVGEKYVIYGTGTTQATPLYILADADRNVISLTKTNSRNSGVEVTINNGTAFLVVNLSNYDPATDRVMKAVISTEKGLNDEIKKIKEKVTELDGKTVEVVDSLDNDNSKKALSAKQGKLLNEKTDSVIREINGGKTEVWSEVSLTLHRYYNLSTTQAGDAMPSINGSSTTKSACTLVTINKGDAIKINAPIGSSAVRNFAICKDGVIVAISGYSTPIEDGIIAIDNAGNITLEGCSISRGDITQRYDSVDVIVNINGYDDAEAGTYYVKTRSYEYSGGLILRIKALENKPDTEIVDSLNSNDPSKALSAKQGKVLNEKNDELGNIIGKGTAVDVDVVYNGSATALNTNYRTAEGKYWSFISYEVGQNVIDKVANSGGSASTCNAARCTMVKGVTYKVYGHPSRYASIAIFDADGILRVKITDGDYSVNPYVFTAEYDGWIITQTNNYTDYPCKVAYVTYEKNGILKDIEDLNKKIDDIGKGRSLALEGKKIVVFGDSLSEFKNGAGKTWSNYFEEYTGATIINCAIGGSRISQNRSKGAIITDTTSSGYTNTMNIYSGVCMLNLIRALCGERFNDDYTYKELALQFVQSMDANKQAAVARLSSAKLDEIDAIIIVGGGNDWQSGATFGTTGGTDTSETHTIGAVNNIARLLAQYAPKIPIYYVTPPPFYATSIADENWADVCKMPKKSDGSGEPVEGANTLKEFAAKMQQEFSLYHIPSCDMYNTIGFNQFNFSAHFVDHAHPTKSLDRVGKKISSFVVANNIIV